MKAQRGLTLIEVLIALAILSIALTAVIKSTSLNIKDTHYLQQKTIATFVATDIIRQIQVGLLKPPLSEKTNMLNQAWWWEAHLLPTPNPHIKQIQVSVSEHEKSAAIAQLVGYIHE